MEPELEALVIKYVPLAQAIAVQVWKTAPYALDVEELKGIAYWGLTESASRWEAYCERRGFDPDRKEFFRVYATRRIRGAIIDSFRSADWATRSLRTKHKQLQKAGQADGATSAELADRTGLSEVEVRSTVLAMSMRPVSLEDNNYNTERETDQSVEDIASTNSLLSVFAKSVRELPVESKIILILRYYANKDLHEISSIMALSESVVSQLHAEAIISVRDDLQSAASEGENDVSL